MFYVNNRPILVSDEEVISTLQSELHKLNINLLQFYRVSPKSIMIPCIYHKNGQEKKPSCGILRSSNNNETMVHCFTCGAIVSLEVFISNAFGVKDIGQYGADWLKANFQTNYENRYLDLDFSRDKKPLKVIIEEDYKKYKMKHPYMYQRKLNDYVIDLYDLGYDKSFKLGDYYNEAITFPVKNIDGKCLFIARRFINNKIFNYPKKKKKPLYGLYEAMKDADYVYITEIIINALTLRSWGYNSVSLMGLGNDYQIEQINNLSYRCIIFCLDGDSAGFNATLRLSKKIHKLKYKVVIPQNMAGAMLSGILSDTLLLKSPTTTSLDKEAVMELEKIADVNYQTYGFDMFKAGSSLEGMTKENIIFQDFKKFNYDNQNIGVGQVFTTDVDYILNEKEQYIDILNNICNEQAYNIVTLFITDIINNGSYILYNDNAHDIIQESYKLDRLKQGHYLKNVVSRKKQMIPPILETLEKHS